MSKKIQQQLSELSFSKNEIKVYITLTQLGEASASIIAKKANLPRTTVISILKKLDTQNYISIQNYHGKNIYWIESPNMIKKNLQYKLDIANELEEALGELYRAEADFPYAKVYDTKDSIKSFIEELIYKTKKCTIVYTIDNPKSGNYKKILSEDFYYNMIEMKNKNKIFTKTLVPYNTKKTIDPHKIIDRNIELRELPPTIDFKSSLWIIDDTLVLFSGKYPFIVSINHKIITLSIKSFFNYFWNLSEKQF